MEQQQQAAVLFVDICGSTAFFDRYGELAGRHMVERCFEIVVPEVEQRAGRVVKYLGDGLLAVFPSARELVVAAEALHKALADDNETRPEAARIRIHSGADAGAITTADDGDVYGDAVNVASRVQGVAGPDQIYVTSALVEELAAAERAKIRRVGEFPLRGKDGEVELHEIMWRVDGATVIVSRSAMREEVLLSLFHAGQVFEIEPGRQRFTMGRTPGNDLVVEDNAVSREHAEIVRRRGLAYLVDRSTNGTYVRPQMGKTRHLHREETLLDGGGEFSLGRADGPPIEYKVS